jgi:hypothetical protein
VKSEGASVVETLHAWHALLQDAADDSTFETLWSQAWVWLTGDAAGAIDDLLDREVGWAESFAPFQRRSLALDEAREAERLMAANWRAGDRASERVRTDFGRHTYDRVPEVLRLADFARCRRFVMVGCGAFPAAALLVRDATEVPEIVALDVDARAAAIARRVVEAMGDPRIRIDCRDGTSYDYAGAGVVYLANQVSGKARVLERVHETAPADAAVILRDPFGVGRLLAESVAHRLPPPFRVATLGAPNPDFYSRHVALSRGAAQDDASISNPD